MTTEHIAVSQRENYTPSGFTGFLWWLSTAEKELLKEAVVDRNRYAIIGMSVLATWIFATLAWTYFFSTIVGSFWISLALGLFMGFIILTIDRALIKGINKFNKRKFLPLLFRGLLAVTIGTFMAQPTVLYMFEKEIKLQTSFDNEQRKMAKQQQLDSFFNKQKSTLNTNLASMKDELSLKEAAVSKARENFLSETDGSGGSGKVGIKDIAIAKRDEYQKLDGEYQQLSKTQQLKIDSTEAALKHIDTQMKAEQDKFSTYFNDGFLTRIEALAHLLKDSPALQFRYYLIVFILLLIELMPVIAKTLLPSGSYDEKVMLREAMEIRIANGNTDKEMQLKELYNRLAFEADSGLLREFFEQAKQNRGDKMEQLSKRWKDHPNQSFDGFWEQVKKDILSKQEN